jgi:hypothetical protein
MGSTKLCKTDNLFILPRKLGIKTVWTENKSNRISDRLIQSNIECLCTQ